MLDIILRLLNNPIIVVLLILVLLSILSMLKNGKIKKIGKDGIEINGADTATKEDIRKLGKDIEGLAATVHHVDLATIRLQILSSNTSLETKLNLYDEYKGKGGNSYIKLYVEGLQEEEKCAKN